jgi:hypothetical protein
MRSKELCGALDEKMSNAAGLALAPLSIISRLALLL